MDLNGKQRLQHSLNLLCSEFLRERSFDLLQPFPKYLKVARVSKDLLADFIITHSDDNKKKRQFLKLSGQRLRFVRVFSQRRVTFQCVTPDLVTAYRLGRKTPSMGLRGTYTIPEICQQFNHLKPEAGLHTITNSVRTS
jgi:hypothetical protein